MKRGWLVIALLAGVVTGCGGALSVSPINTQNSVTQNSIPLSTPAENLSSPLSKQAGFFRIIDDPKAYAGEVVVFFKTAADANKADFLLRKYSGVAKRRSVDRTFEEEQARHRKLEAKTGRKFLDWNRVYHFTARSPETAKKLIADLMQIPEVSLVYPEQKKYSPSLASVPNLEGQQTYLEGETQGGLNIRHAWEQGVFGEGVMVSDNEEGFNLDHEEFDLSRTGPSHGGSVWGVACDPTVADLDGWDCASPKIAHGTGVVGMLHARHRNDGGTFGVKGIAPDAWMTLGPATMGLVPMGSIGVVECAERYSWDGDLTCDTDASGSACVPCMTTAVGYASYLEIIFGADLSIFLTAGNGGIDFDVEDLISDEALEEVCGPLTTATRDCWNLADINLVGASTGNTMSPGRDGDMRPRKQSYSNCGGPVNLYGWGERVVTTTWSNSDTAIEGYDWIGGTSSSTPPNDHPNRRYTNQFGGTSAATAMVAGAAVLTQSYFKDIANETESGDHSLALHRYLTPKKLREILVESGIDASEEDGCSIGKQPQVDNAFLLVRSFLDSTLTLYPELNSGELTESRLSALHNRGIGLICKAHRPEESDPACPENLVNPPIVCTGEETSGECFDDDLIPHIAKKMDFDEDGRGDLVSYSRGTWKIDLSSGGACVSNTGEACPAGGDNYGAWDLTLITGIDDGSTGKVIPVVDDYNSDGRADLAVYDRRNGRWSIAFTDLDLLRGEWDGWDVVASWPGTADRDVFDTASMRYTRPLPADYNNDGWVDLGVQTSDGHWKINFNWRTSGTAGSSGEWSGTWSGAAFENFPPTVPDFTENEYGSWASAGIWDLAYLTAAELAEYPGWSYLPLIEESPIRSNLPTLYWKSPSGQMKTTSVSGDEIFNLSDYGYPSYGDFDATLVLLELHDIGTEIGVKNPDGTFLVYDRSDDSLAGIGPTGIFGNIECKPVFGVDLDGDNWNELIVQCPDEWRIFYTGRSFLFLTSTIGVRTVPLGYENKETLPGQPSFGGLPYDRILQVRSRLNSLGRSNVPPFFDYLITPFEYCDLPWPGSSRPTECR